jgi:hypothetical protein
MTLPWVCLTKIHVHHVIFCNTYLFTYIYSHLYIMFISTWIITDWACHITIKYCHTKSIFFPSNAKWKGKVACIEATVSKNKSEFVSCLRNWLWQYCGFKLVNRLNKVSDKRIRRRKNIIYTEMVWDNPLFQKKAIICKINKVSFYFYTYYCFFYNVHLIKPEHLCFT